MSFIPFSRPSIGKEEISEVVDSLESGWLTTGPKVERLEQMFCTRLDLQDCLAVNSGTAAWHLLAKCLDLGKGDEVIVPAITWVSMVNVIELLGATPVFADVDIDTAMLLPEEVERLQTDRTKAILPVHFAGAAANLDSYKSVMNEGVLLVEDAAHALGGEYRGVEIGSCSDAAIFSFHPTKNVTTGEGGLLVCKDPQILQRARNLSLNGVGKSSWERLEQGQSEVDVLEPGYKYNMLDIQAALGLHQLPKLDGFIEKRTELAEYYDFLLKDIDEIRPIGRVSYEHKHAWHIYVVKINFDILDISRAQFVFELKKQHIGVGLHFKSVHQFSYYKNKYPHANNTLTNSTELGESVISLPLFPAISKQDQEYVVTCLKKIVGSNLKRKWL